MSKAIGGQCLVELVQKRKKLESSPDKPANNESDDESEESVSDDEPSENSLLKSSDLKTSDEKKSATSTPAAKPESSPSSSPVPQSNPLPANKAATPNTSNPPSPKEPAPSLKKVTKSASNPEVTKPAPGMRSRRKKKKTKTCWDLILQLKKNKIAPQPADQKARPGTARPVNPNRPTYRTKKNLTKRQVGLTAAAVDVFFFGWFKICNFPKKKKKLDGSNGTNLHRKASDQTPNG